MTLIVIKKQKSLINRPNNKNIKSKQDAAINNNLYLVGKNRMMIFFESCIIHFIIFDG